MSEPDLTPYWNTNVARHPGILRAVPVGCGDALDVGCGDGLLARKLAGRAKRVTGIDNSATMIARARELAAGHPEPAFVEGDFLTAELPAEGYDFICSVTAIHHMDFEAALTRMRELLRPGGTLIVVGLAREATPADWAARIACAPLVRATKALRRARGPEGMPVCDPRMTYAQVRGAARRLLPGVRYRWHVLRRYSLTWEKPAR
jgi:SAM-dependent methyltransferase